MRSTRAPHGLKKVKPGGVIFLDPSKTECAQKLLPRSHRTWKVCFGNLEGA